MRTLHQCLLHADLARLQVIARFWDVDLTAGRQREVAAELAEAMISPQAIAVARDALPDDQRRALKALLAAGGLMPLQVFSRQWGEIRAMGPGRLEREHPWREPISPAEGLWYHGLLYRTFDQGPEGAFEVAFVPEELRPHLPAATAPAPRISLESTSEPGVVRSTGDTFLDDACTLLAFLQNERLRPRQDGTWPSRHETQLAGQLRDPDPARLDLLRHLAHTLDWLRLTTGPQTSGGHLRPNPGPAIAWLQLPAADEQRRQLAEAWRDDATWNDLFHVPTLAPQDTGAWHNDPVLARGAILQHVRACVAGTWYGIDAFAAAVRQVDADFQRPDGDYATWYIRDATSGDYLSGFENWDRVEGALIRYLLTCPLAWLGLTDVGTRAPGEPLSAFRLTPAGAAFLGLGKPAPEPTREPMALRAGWTVTVSPARRFERFQLARVADWVASPSAAHAGKKGATFTYRITPASLERARRQGIPVARVLAFLDEMTEAPLPRLVADTLAHWDARGTEVRLERTIVLSTASEPLMDQILASPATRRLIQERVGPVHALVRARDCPRLVEALGKLGTLAEIAGIEP